MLYILTRETCFREVILGIKKKTTHMGSLNNIICKQFPCFILLPSSVHLMENANTNNKSHSSLFYRQMYNVMYTIRQQMIIYVHEKKTLDRSLFKALSQPNSCFPWRNLLRPEWLQQHPNLKLKVEGIKCCRRNILKKRI